MKQVYAPNLLRITKAIEMSGLSQVDFVRYVRDGKLKPDYVTSGGHKYFDSETLMDKVNNLFRKDDVIIFGNEDEINNLRIYCLAKNYTYNIVYDMNVLVDKIVNENLYKIIINENCKDEDKIKFLCNLKKIKIEKIK